MVDPKAAKFINSLVKSLQMLCHGYMDFNENIEIIGHINLRIDNNQKFDYIVNEQVSKQGDDSTFFQSNSYHSLPPAKTGRERHKSASERTDEGDTLNLHSRLDDTVGGSRIQVDLSGPMPVARSTDSVHDNFFSPSSNASDSTRRRSHSRDSHGRVDDDLDKDMDSILSSEDHPRNHSNVSGSREREMLEHRASINDSKTDTSSMSVVRELDKSRQQNIAEIALQEGTVLVKAEPEDCLECSMDEGDQNREHDRQGIPPVSCVLPMAHHSAMVSNAAHSGHSMYGTAGLGHPTMFDANLVSQDIADSRLRDSSYRPLRSVSAEDHESEMGQDLTKQGSENKNGVAMSLVTRNRPSDSNYPMGPMQLPQTADAVKEPAPPPGQNRCDYCGKHFRTAELLQMHIALIHSHSSISNYLTLNSLRHNRQLGSFLQSPSLSPSHSQQRRASQSPGRGSTGSRSKSESPISVLPQTQPLALTQQQQSPISCLPSSASSPTSTLAMSLPTSCDTTTVHAAAAAVAAAALAQSYSMDKSSHPSLMDCKSSGLQQNAYQCHLCRMPFVNWAVLAQHQASCPRRGPHKCGQCGKAFRSKTSLTDHINTIHRHILFVCKGCNETFKWRTHIYQHKRKCPALQNMNFESGSFIEERQGPIPDLAAPSVSSHLHGESEDMEDAPPLTPKSDSSLGT